MFKSLGEKNRRYAFVGDKILVSIKRLRSKRRAFSKVKKGEIHQAVIVRTKTKTKHLNGDNISF